MQPDQKIRQFGMVELSIHAFIEQNLHHFLPFSASLHHFKG